MIFDNGVDVDDRGVTVQPAVDPGAILEALDIFGRQTGRRRHLGHGFDHFAVIYQSRRMQGGVRTSRTPLIDPTFRVEIDDDVDDESLLVFLIFFEPFCGVKWTEVFRR